MGLDASKSNATPTASVQELAQECGCFLLKQNSLILTLQTTPCLLAKLFLPALLRTCLPTKLYFKKSLVGHS